MGLTFPLKRWLRGILSESTLWSLKNDNVGLTLLHIRVYIIGLVWLTNLSKILQKRISVLYIWKKGEKLRFLKNRGLFYVYINMKFWKRVLGTRNGAHVMVPGLYLHSILFRGKGLYLTMMFIWIVQFSYENLPIRRWLTGVDLEKSVEYIL